MLAEDGTLGILVLHVEGVAPVPVFEGRLAEPSVGPLGGDGQGRGRLLLGGRIEDGLAGGEPRQPVVDGL